MGMGARGLFCALNSIMGKNADEIDRWLRKENGQKKNAELDMFKEKKLGNGH